MVQKRYVKKLAKVLSVLLLVSQIPVSVINAAEDSDMEIFTEYETEYENGNILNEENMKGIETEETYGCIEDTIENAVETSIDMNSA